MTERRGVPATRSEAKKTWQLVELHGCWWAYEGSTANPRAISLACNRGGDAAPARVSS